MVGDRQHVAAEPLHCVGALRHARLAVAAAVVAHHAEMLRPGLHLLVPHVHGGAERIAEDQHRCVGRTFHLEIELAAVISLDRGHRFLARVDSSPEHQSHGCGRRRAAEPCDKGSSGRLVLRFGRLGLLVFVFGRAREHLEQRARPVLRLFDRRCVGDHWERAPVQPTAARPQQPVSEWARSGRWLLYRYHWRWLNLCRLGGRRRYRFGQVRNGLVDQRGRSGYCLAQRPDGFFGCDAWRGRRNRRFRGRSDGLTADVAVEIAARWSARAGGSFGSVRCATLLLRRTARPCADATSRSMKVCAQP